MKQISIKRIFKAVVIILAVLYVGRIVIDLPIFAPLRLMIEGRKTVEGRLSEYEGSVIGRIQPIFKAQDVPFPPRTLTLLFIKSKKTLSLYATSEKGDIRLIKVYKVLASSGRPGPKLREGDYQVPEGIYSIESLNPNSAYHLALRIGYPNSTDEKYAREDGRTKLGSDIMIHGNDVSIGCIAIGDEAIEELFVLAAKSGYRKWKVILSPVDFRIGEIPSSPRVPVKWLPDLYAQIKNEMSSLPQ